MNNTLESSPLDDDYADLLTGGNFTLDEVLESVHSFKNWHEIIKTVCFVTISVFGLATNILAFGVIISDPKVFKRPSCIFTLNLIVTDLFLLATLPFHISLISQGQWNHGWLICKGTNSVTFINSFVVIFILVGMAFDRYCTVCTNDFTTVIGKHRVSPGYLITIIGSIWIMSFAISWPVFSRSTLIDDMCGMNWNQTSTCNGTRIVNYVRFACSCGFTNAELSFRLQLFLLVFLVPLLLIVLFYWRIAKVVIDSDRRVSSSSNCGKKDGKKSSLISITKADEKAQRKGLNHRMTKKTRRMLKMIISLILSYCVCWLPYHLWTISVWWSLISGQWCEWAHSAYSICIWLHSATNPIFYVFMGADCRKRWSSIIYSFRLSNSQRSTKPTSINESV